MRDSYANTVALVRLAVERVASAPEDEQRYLELNFALDRAVARDLRYSELRRLFEEGARTAAPEVAWAWLLATGLSANLMGDNLAALRALEEARDAMERAGRDNSAAASFVQSEMARACYHAGDHVAGVEAATRALQLARAANSLLAEAYGHHYLGLISVRRRDYDFARRHLETARERFEYMQQRQGRARVLDSLAALDMESGRYESARQLLEESYAVKEDLNDLRGQALSCGNLARLYMALGDYPRAMHYLDRERDLTSRVGDERNATQARIHLGELHLRHGNPTQAREELLEACRMAQGRADTRLEAHAAFTLAEAEHQLGNLQDALRAVIAACDYFNAADDAVMRERAAVRRALLEGEDLQAPAVREPLVRLRASGASSQLAEALFEAATFFRLRDRASEVATLYAEALDVAEPAQADQLAAIMRSRADHPEGRAWVDAMMAVKHQKDRLEHAYADLRQAERHRESLMQMIVHDLKNPLTAIMPWLQTMQMGVLDPAETEEYLQTTIDECEHLLRMIEDLNDVGKMQVGSAPELQREPLDLPGMMEDVARRLQARARDNGLAIVVKACGEPLPGVTGDANKVRRVLENLVANSIKYGKPPERSGRPAEIHVAACFEPRDPLEGVSSVRVEVRDFGPGIPPAEAERVFEPYYQAEAGRKRKAGVGLGLAFSRMVVEAHGGTIWTQPNPEGGTIFAFRLPQI